MSEKRKPRSQPTWTDVKAKLASFDPPGLVGLIHDLYVANRENRTFLQARLGVATDALQSYKETLDRWLWPDVLRNQNTSVAKAKQAISSYRKAVDDPAGLTELMVFYCECAAGFCNDLGNQDEGYFDALVRMFEQALKVIGSLPPPDRDVLIARLDRVRIISHNLGHGVGDDMDSLLTRYSRA
jgi:hypothetical protein